jgi:hypothetical protein
MTQFLTSLLPFAVLAVLWIVLVGTWQRRHAREPRVEPPESRAESRGPRDLWSGGTIHTYRDPHVLEHKASLGRVARGGVALGLFLVLLGLAFVGLTRGFTSSEVEVAVALGLFLAITYVGDRQHRSRVCAEIRLADDGTCDLETKGKVIRLHVNQIESVKYLIDPDSRAHYSISYHGGSVPVTSTMTRFPDFLSRLKTLNPAVDMTSFPSKTWPDLHPPTIRGGRTDWARLVRSALFPLIVITLLVYLASQTFLGN